MHRLLGLAVAGTLCVAAPAHAASPDGLLAQAVPAVPLQGGAAGGRAPARAAEPAPRMAQSQPEAPAAAAALPTRPEILRFENWIVTCNEFDAPKKRVCEARLSLSQSNNNQVLLVWTIWINDAKQLQARVQMPTGVSIPPGVELQPEKGAVRKLAFESCDTGFCLAGTVMDAALVRDLTASSTADIFVQAANGNRIRFPLPIKGFDKAYAAVR
jgi:invasion protein IalB